MPAFVPITIYLDRIPTVIASIPDAAKALDQPWPYMGKRQRHKAIRMIRECMAGHCSQQAAIDAFKAAANEQGLLKQRPPRVGIKGLGGIVDELM